METSMSIEDEMPNLVDLMPGDVVHNDHTYVIGAGESLDLHAIDFQEPQLIHES